MSLYDDLGVRPDATEDEIAAAYRRAAKQHHPDTGGDTEKFQRAQTAANILRDPAKRAQYDTNGTIEERSDNALAEAMQVLSSAFEAAFSQVQDMAHTDVVKLMTSNIQQRLNGLTANKLAGKNRLDRISEALERLQYRGDRQDFIGKILRGQIQSIDRQLIEIGRTEKIYDSALDIAKDYVWSVDINPAQWEGLDELIAIKGWPKGKRQ